MSDCTLVASISQRNLKIRIPRACSGGSLRSSRLRPRKVYKVAHGWSWWTVGLSISALGDRERAFLLLAVAQGPVQWPARSRCSIHMYWMSGQFSLDRILIHMLILSVIPLTLCHHCSLSVPLLRFPCTFIADCWSVIGDGVLFTNSWIKLQGGLSRVVCGS